MGEIKKKQGKLRIMWENETIEEKSNLKRNKNTN